jgi:hypothetical protein
MDRRPPATAAIFTAPTKILPRVRPRGVMRSIGANLLTYTQKPAVNLALLLLAGTLLVAMGFLLGSARRDAPTVAGPTRQSAVEPAGAGVAATGATGPVAVVTSPPIAPIAVSSLPIAPPKEQGSARTSAGPTPAHAPSADIPLLPDRPVSSGEKAFVPPVRNPGF